MDRVVPAEHRGSVTPSAAGAEHVLLLTGLPGVGKTTVVRAAVAQLGAMRLSGFVTEELRRGGRRTGFVARSLDGREATLASVERAAPPRVGRYGVDVAALDRLSESALALREDVDLYVVDEIGKMECLSPIFVERVTRLLDSRTPVLATVGARGGGLIASVKRRPDAELWQVSVGNRNALPARILGWLNDWRAP